MQVDSKVGFQLGKRSVPLRLTVSGTLGTLKTEKKDRVGIRIFFYWHREREREYRNFGESEKREERSFFFVLFCSSRSLSTFGKRRSGA